MQPVTPSVFPPEAMNDEWLGTPSDHWSNRYSTFYHYRKLNQEKEGWTVWIARGVVRNTFAIVQTGAAFVAKNLGITAATVIMRNEVPYRAVEAGAKLAHEFYTASTRRPIDHERVDKVVTKLHLIKTCSNSQAFVERVQTVYTKGYFASNGSYNLSAQLASSEISTTGKIDCMIQYLTIRPDRGFNDLYYNNGKRYYQAIVCLAENSVIK